MESSARARSAAPPEAIPGEGTGVPLTDAQFQRISELLRRITGIDLKSGKEQLVKARLWKRVHALGLRDYREYLDLVESSRGVEELTRMVEALTTHETYFFREPQHFDFLRARLQNWFSTHRSLRIWSAGCSTGEEPYSIAMTVCNCLPEAPQRDVRILATDVSGRVLQAAREGHYSEQDVSGVPPPDQARYLTTDPTDAAEPFRIKDPPRRLVTFAKLNLMQPWPMQGPFHFIFCRNVMIYFDRATQTELAGRFAELLAPGGALLVGHSESLRGGTPGLRFVLPATYERQLWI
jgi:chemotaxis protein methyltransferase CheR